MNRYFFAAGIFVICVPTIAADLSAEMFERRYLAWKESVKPTAWLKSTARGYVDNLEFQAIVDLGPSALPHIVAKMESDAAGNVLWHAIRKIAKVQIREKYDAATNRLLFPDYPELKNGDNVYLHWWRKGRFQTSTRFEKLYAEWKTLRKEKKNDDAGRVYRQIVNLGLPVLPCLVGVVTEHSEFIAAVSELTDGALPKTANPEECREWWAKNKVRFALPPLTPAEENSDQSANVGDSKSVEPPSRVANGAATNATVRCEFESCK